MNLLKLINHMAATFDLQHKCTFFNIGNYKNIVAFKLKQQIISFLNWVMRIFTAIWNASIMGCYVLKKHPMYHPTFSTVHLTVALATWIFLSEAHTIKTYQQTFWSQVLVFSLWMVQQLAIWSSLRILSVFIFGR